MSYEIAPSSKVCVIAMALALMALSGCEPRPPKPKTADVRENPSQTVIGAFDSVRTALRECRLLEARLRNAQIVLSANVSEDDIAAEAPGQSFDNHADPPALAEINGVCPVCPHCSFAR